MKAVLICPLERSGISQLTDRLPLPLLPVCGKELISHWIEHLAGKGANHVIVLAADRPEMVRTALAEGCRWGIKVEVLPEARELTIEEARTRFKADHTFLAAPNDVVSIEGLPGQVNAGGFATFSNLFAVCRLAIGTAATADRIGIRQVAPGVWAGLRTRIHPKATLVGPAWIGENVQIDERAVIGPNAIIENDCIVERGVEVFDSLVLPSTFVGAYTQIRGSIASGNLLINWKNESSVEITDAFLLSSIEDEQLRRKAGHMVGRVVALSVLALSAPLMLWAVTKAAMKGQRVLRARKAVVPETSRERHQTITYFEFANSTGWWRRWPQLWSVVKGDFAWVGNRPLNQIEASRLFTEFDRLWLAAPIGFVSQADAVGTKDMSTDENRAHSSFYAVQGSWRLDCQILVRAAWRAFLLMVWPKAAVENNSAVTRAVEVARGVIR